MDKFMLTEAFNLAEEVEEFTLGASGLNELDSFLDMAGDTSMMDDETMIIDLEAQAEEELKQSYVGKVIINCNCCKSNIFIDKEEIEIGEEEDCVNLDMECPYCHSIGEGFAIIGEVKPYAEEEEEVEVTEEEPEVEETEIEEPEKIDESLKESFNMNNEILHRVERLLKDFNNVYVDESGFIENFTSRDAAQKACEILRHAGFDCEFYASGIPENEFTIEVFGYEKENLEESLTEDLDSAVEVEFECEDCGHAWTERFEADYFEDEEDLESTIEYSDADCPECGGHAHAIGYENLEEGLKADRVAKLRKHDRLNGKLGLGRELESSDEVRGPHYTELNEERENCETEESLEEDIQAVSIATEDEIMTMETKEDGGVVVETEPVVEEEEAEVEEMVAPLEAETAEEIEDAQEEIDEPELEEEPEEEEVEDEMEFDEESFNGLGESYLKKCYDNVNSFNTTSVNLNEGVLTIEGKIGFASGNEKTTKFVFEGFSDKNKQRLTGCNEQISRGKKSFKLGCNVENGKVVCESLNYNYKTKNENDESVRVYGTVRKAK